MPTFKRFLISCSCASLWIGATYAQFGRSTGWTTEGGDGQRSSWIRTDAKISVAKMGPGFGLAWKIKVPGGEPGMATTLDSYIGYRGFRAYVVAGTGAGQITTFDSDLGRVEWTKAAPGAAARATAGCSATLGASVVRPTSVAFPAAAPAARGGGGGRGGPAKGDVGQPGEGAVIIQQVAANAAANAARGGGGGRGAAPGAPGAPGGRGAAAGVAGARPARPVETVSFVSADGSFHKGYISSGNEKEAAMKFVPAGSHPRYLTFVNGTVYAATSGGCGGAPNAVWALDTESQKVIHWSPVSGDIAGGGFAFGPDAKVYVAGTNGDLVALDPKNFEVSGVYKAGQPFSGSPVIFEYKSKTFVAAPTKDGHIHVVNAEGMSGSAYAGSAAGQLGFYQDANGVPFLLATTKDSVTTWKVNDQADAPSLSTGWTAPIASPGSAITINGVVFALSTSPTAVLHALDGSTGKELWSSGKTMVAPTKSGGLSGSGSQVYVGTSDGTLYAFAFPIEH